MAAPKLSFFIFCEGLVPSNSPEGMQVNPVGITHIFTPLYMPTAFSFSLMFGVLGITPLQHHQLSIAVLGPDGEELAAQNVEMPPQPHKDNHLDDDMQGFIFATDLKNVALHKNGIHKVRVIVDGALIGEAAIKIKAVNVQ